MADLYSLIHVDHGPVSTFLTREEAEQELADVLGDEPMWAGDVCVEGFELVEASS
jgi:hypothetical protein